jgi:hypothetical protein
VSERIPSQLAQKYFVQKIKGRVAVLFSSHPMSPMISALEIVALRIMCWFAMKLRPRFVHPHRTPIEQHSIQRSHSGLGFSRLRHLDKSDTAGLARVPVHDDRDSLDGSMCCKNFSQLLLCYRDIKVPDKNVGHEFIPATDLPERPPGTRSGIYKRRS